MWSPVMSTPSAVPLLEYELGLVTSLEWNMVKMMQYNF